MTALQQMLINKGYLTAVSAPTGYFGALTQKALAAFQSANGISPAAGYFGPKTRAFVNSMSVVSRHDDHDQTDAQYNDRCTQIHDGGRCSGIGPRG